MSDILQTRFKKFLTDEGLQPKNKEAYKMLERAFFTGATEYYQILHKTSQEAKIAHPNDEEMVLTVLNRKVQKLRQSISDYWKSQVLKGTKDIIMPQNKIITLDELRRGR